MSTSALRRKGGEIRRGGGSIFSFEKKSKPLSAYGKKKERKKEAPASASLYKEQSETGKEKTDRTIQREEDFFVCRRKLQLHWLFDIERGEPELNACKGGEGLPTNPERKPDESPDREEKGSRGRRSDKGKKGRGGQNRSSIKLSPNFGRGNRRKEVFSKGEKGDQNINSGQGERRAAAESLLKSGRTVAFMHIEKPLAEERGERRKKRRAFMQHGGSSKEFLYQRKLKTKEKSLAGKDFVLSLRKKTRGEINGGGIFSEDRIINHKPFFLQAEGEKSPPSA